MSERGRAWLSARAGAVPPSLEARMETAIDRVLEYDTIHEMLADAARICLREALADPDSRAAALSLLAADALVTYACEAAAQGDGAALRELAQAWSPERLAYLIDGEAAP
ncbi:MAG TPA: hypothetical protein VFZ24_03275 [Longimicrobiales bacterium]